MMAALTSGAPTGIEIAAKDVLRAQAFYTAVFGWKFEPGSGESGVKVISEGNILGGGILQEAEGRRPGPGGVTIYLYVNNMEHALTAIDQAGGHIVESSAAQTPGYSAKFADTEGNVFGLFSLN
ncbi:hypothetical protein F66182_11741 [Fusarium sp. NRRL 66182]|nr:hypothetical protein F66182_11741 [Fusarium sp. NRRL 66182]